jgi:organic hydroperoxide reductase OsmC/OhrA
VFVPSPSVRSRRSVEAGESRYPPMPAPSGRAGYRTTCYRVASDPRVLHAASAGRYRRSVTSTEHHARVVWRGDRQDLRAHEINLAAQTLAGSCAAVRGGDPAKADPEELFVASLSACHMLWFLDLARHERLRILSYEDDPEGTMDGQRFVRVVLRPRVEFEREVPHDVLARLHERSHQACFIANSVTCEVRVEPGRARS